MFLPFFLSFFVRSFSISCDPKYQEIKNPSPLPDPRAPESFTVQFFISSSTSSSLFKNEENLEPIVLYVNRSWSPLGVDRFYSLIQDNYYNCAAFFRVVPNFVVQFGIAGEPSETLKWDTNILDDPVLISNLKGTVSYATAGPNTRTTQIFINYVDNSHLDASGFSPFAFVQSGMETAEAITNPTPGNSNGINQALYTKGGNEWLFSKYPMTNYITTTVLIV